MTLCGKKAYWLRWQDWVLVGIYLMIMELIMVFLKVLLSVLFCSTFWLTMWMGHWGFLICCRWSFLEEGKICLSWDQINSTSYCRLAVERRSIDCRLKWSVLKSCCMFFSKKEFVDNKQLFLYQGSYRQWQVKFKDFQVLFQALIFIFKNHQFAVVHIMQLFLVATRWQYITTASCGSSGPIHAGNVKVWCIFWHVTQCRLVRYSYVVVKKVG